MPRQTDKEFAALTREVPFGEFRSMVLPYADNAIRTGKFRCRTALHQFFLLSVQSPGRFWLLVIASINCALLQEPGESDYSTLIVVFAGLLLAIACELLQERQRVIADTKANEISCKVWNGQDFEEMTSAEVLCGDLLLVENGEQVVGDSVIFFTDRSDGSCCVDNSATLGSMQMTQKSAVTDVQRFSESSSLDRLTATLPKIKGLLRVTPPDSDFAHFSGLIRLLKSPSAASVSLSNFVLRGSRIYGAKWAVCCVVAAGMETKVRLNTTASGIEESPLERAVQKYCRLAIAISLLVILGNMIGYVSSESSPPSTLATILTSFVLFYRLIPALLFLCLDSVRLLQTLRATRIMEGRTRVNPLTSAFAFGEVDYVVADKNCVLTSDRPRVHTIIYRERMFGHCEDYFKGQHSCQEVFRRLKSSIADMQDQCYLFSEKKSYGAPQDRPGTATETEEPRNSCGFRILSAQMVPGVMDDLGRLFECMVLCNTVTQLDPLKARNKYEEALIECGETFGFRVLESIGDHIMLEVGKERVVYKTFAAHYDTRSTEGMSIVVAREGSKRGVLYTKGSVDALGPLLDIDEDLREHIRSMAMELKRTGLVPIVLACRALEEDIFEAVKDRLWIAQSAIVNVEAKVSAIFDRLRTDLKYLGIGCVEDTIGTDCAQGILKLTQAGVGLWVVSSDSEAESTASCLSAGLLGYEGYIVPVTGIKDNFECTKLLGGLVTEFIYRKPLTLDDSFSVPSPRAEVFAPQVEKLILELVPGHNVRLDTYRHILTQAFDPSTLYYSVVIDGVSFDTALQQEQTQCLLAALLFLASGVCFCAMLPHQKAKVVKFLKQSFAFHPVVVTMAEGVGAMAMLGESDLRVGKQRANPEEEPYIFHARVTSLEAFADFIVTAGRRSFKGMRAMVTFLIHENALLLSLAIYYTGLCKFSAVSPVDWQSLWAVSFIATKPGMIFIGLFYADIEDIEAVNHPQIYRWRAKPLTARRLWGTVFLAFLQGALLFVLITVNIDETLSEVGMTENAEVLTAMLSVSAFLTVTAEMAIRPERVDACLGLSLFAGCVVFLIEVLAFNYSPNSLRSYMSMAMDCPLCIARLFLAPVAAALIPFSLEYYGRMFSQSYASYIVNGNFVKDRVDAYQSNLMGVWVPTKGIRNSDSGDLFERTRVTRVFKLPQMENNFRTNIIPEMIVIIRIGFGLLAILGLVCTIVAEEHDASSIYTYLRVLFAVVAFCLFLFSCTKLYRKHYIATNLAALLFFIASTAVYQKLLGQSSPEVAAAVAIFSFLCFAVSFVYMLCLNAVNVVIYVVIAALNEKDEGTKGLLGIANSALLVTAIFVSSAVIGYVIDEMNRERFCLLTKKEIELEKSGSVLKYLLPDFVRTRVKDGVRFIAEIQPQVHILFCELCGFDYMIQEHESVEVITLLNKLYQKFDEICEACNVTKIETVGKVYMACTGIKESEQDLSDKVPRLSKAQRLLYCSFEMVLATEQFRLADGKAVKIKIGIHSGKVIAGVVGFHKPQFSLVGDTVNTASRMCSTLDRDNSVQVSAATFDLVKQSKGVLFEKKVREVKGKGTMEVFIATKDADTKSYRVSMEADDASDDLAKLQRRKSDAFSRGMTLAHRDSLFTSNSEVARALLSKKKKEKWWSLGAAQLWNNSNYRDSLVLRRPKAIRGLAVALVFAVLSAVLEGCILGISGSDVAPMVLRCVACILLALTLVLTCRWFTREHFCWVALVLLAGVFGCYFAEIFVREDLHNVSSAYAMILLITITFVHSTGLLSYQLVPSLLIVAVVFAESYVESDGQEETVRMAISLGIMVVFGVYSCYRDVRLTKFIELKQVVQAEIAKTNHLLENLLPHHVLDNLRLENAISDCLEHTTLLVADIVGFTAYSTDKEPSEVIEMLSNLFTKFDKLCLKFNAYKVYTIGDCYIAMGFSRKREERDPRQECVNIVKMAFALKEVIAQVNDDQFTQLDMRIGVHTGEVIGAIVGTDIVRYDIYGRDVLIAFKMEANSRPGYVNVSAASRAYLESAAPGAFSYEENRIVDIPAIRTQVPCYFVRPESDSSL